MKDFIKAYEQTAHIYDRDEAAEILAKDTLALLKLMGRGDTRQLIMENNLKLLDEMEAMAQKILKIS